MDVPRCRGTSRRQRPKVRYWRIEGQDFPGRYLGTSRTFLLCPPRQGLPKTLVDYLVWIRKYFDVDVKSKTLKEFVSGRRQSSSSTTCDHSKVHHKGSSARFIRITCDDHNELIFNVERNPPTTDPDLCAHLRTDHRWVQ